MRLRYGHSLREAAARALQAAIADIATWALFKRHRSLLRDVPRGVELRVS